MGAPPQAETPKGTGGASGNGQMILHASTVAIDGKAVLIRGVAGSGKSSLALQLMGYGAALIADDRTEIRRQGDHLIASCPPAISGKIEARGVGILNAAPAPPCPIALIIDLDQTETERLPPHRSENLLGLRLPLLHNTGINHFSAAILQYLRGGRAE